MMIGFLLRSPHFKMRCWIITYFCLFPIIVVNPVSPSYILAKNTTVSPNTTNEPSYNVIPFVPSSSRIILIWDLGLTHLTNSTISFSAHYRSSVATFPKFDDCRAHEILHYCEAFGTQVIEDSASVISTPVSGPTERIDYDCRQNRFIQVKFNKLKFPGTEYEFHLEEDEYIAEGKSEHRTASIRARTLIEKPKDAPKTGAGCFQILNVTEKTRTVKVFWRKMLTTKYRVEVYEEGDLSPILTEEGPADRGWMVKEISLNRHYFIFRTINKLGISDSFSVVNVPPQDQILPSIVLVSSAVRDTVEKSVTLFWDRPEGIRITNYTIFWVDFSDGEENLSIHDFIHVPVERSSFKAYLTNGTNFAALPLGISANTEFSSTGL